MIPLNAYTAFLSGDSRQDISIFRNKHAKGGKTALFDAVSSGDSRHSAFVTRRLFAFNHVRKYKCIY